MNEDQNHLKMLSVANYWFGGLGMFFSFFPMIHVVMAGPHLRHLRSWPEAMGKLRLPRLVGCFLAWDYSSLPWG